MTTTTKERAIPTVDLDDLVRLEEIEASIAELLVEAERLVRRNGAGGVYERAKSYWLAHIAIALNDEHDYVAKGMCTLRKTREELESWLEECSGDGEPIPEHETGVFRGHEYTRHNHKERHPCEHDEWLETCDDCHHAGGVDCPFDE